MNPSSERLLRGFALSAILAVLPGPAQSDDEPPRQRAVSERMRDAILAEFRNRSAAMPRATDQPSAGEEPGVVTLPEMEIRAPLPAKPPSTADVTAPTEAIPLKLGTGITEYRGKKVTMLTQRVLFIPIGFKLEW